MRLIAKPRRLSQSKAKRARALRARAEHEGVTLPPLVVGGIHPTMVPEEVMRDGVWDHVGVGECEDSLLELVRRVEAGESSDDVPNFLSWPDGVRPSDSIGGWNHNAVGPFPDFTQQPLPDYGLFDTQRITDLKNGWFSVMTSRGCPYRCTYCLNHRIVDTYKAETAAAALDAGARLVNDIGGLRLDPELAHATAEGGGGLVLMHSRSTPQ